MFYIFIAILYIIYLLDTKCLWISVAKQWQCEDKQYPVYENLSRCQTTN